MDLARWRQLISSDMHLQRRIVEARSVEELKAMCEHPDYRLYFTRIKWSQIMQCVAEIVFAQGRFGGTNPSFSARSASAHRVGIVFCPLADFLGRRRRNVGWLGLECLRWECVEQLELVIVHRNLLSACHSWNFAIKRENL